MLVRDAICHQPTKTTHLAEMELNVVFDSTNKLAPVYTNVSSYRCILKTVRRYMARGAAHSIII